MIGRCSYTRRIGLILVHTVFKREVLEVRLVAIDLNNYASNHLLNSLHILSSDPFSRFSFSPQYSSLPTDNAPCFTPKQPLQSPSPTLPPSNLVPPTPNRSPPHPQMQAPASHQHHHPKIPKPRLPHPGHQRQLPQAELCGELQGSLQSTKVPRGELRDIRRDGLRGETRRERSRRKWLLLGPGGGRRRFR